MASSETIRERWAQFAEAIERMAERIADPNDFEVRPDSSLAGDDRASHPFEVSQTLRHLINATVDQLHGVKTAVHDGEQMHIAVSATLARAALENAAAGLWILGPQQRNERILRTLRWHSRNYADQAGHARASGLYTEQFRAAHDEKMQRIALIAEGRGIDAALAQKGYATTAPIKGGGEFTELPVFTDWQIASGFAHGRPWTHFGFTDRIRSGGSPEHPIYTVSPREDFTLYLPIQALHLLAELLRLRDRRAGQPMTRLPDGSPDSEPTAYSRRR